MRASDADREQVAKILHDAMAEGRLTVHELDERLQATYAAKTLGDLEPMTKDLSISIPAASRAVSRRIGGTPTSSASIAILSGADRKGDWVVPRNYQAVAIMGGIDLDLTQARFVEFESVINVFAFWGGVDIVVPEDVNVRVEGIGIMGAFDNRIRENNDSPDSPLVRITGLAMMAGVDVKRPKRSKRDRKRLEE